MSKARELAELGAVYDSGALSNRNLIINGAMTVAQRNTSVNEINNANDDYWTTDRWKNIGSGSITGKVNMSQDSDAPDGFKYSTKFAVHTADTAIAADHAWRVEQHIEAGSLRHLNYGVGSTTGKKITLSFWVKSNLTGNWSVGLYMDSTTGGTSTNKENSQTYTINSANTWEYKTLTFIPNTDTNMNSTDNDHGLRLWFHLAAGSDYTGGSQNVWGGDSNRAAGHNVNFFSSTSNTWQYTGVQLEVGESATPFEHRSYGDELARCQRYYYRHVNGDNQFVGGGDMYTTSQLNANIDFPTAMRAFPSLVAASGTNYYIAYGAATSTNVTNSWNLFKEHTNAATIYVTPTSTVTAGSGMRVITSSASGSIAFDAEL